MLLVSDEPFQERAVCRLEGTLRRCKNLLSSEESYIPVGRAIIAFKTLGFQPAHESYARLSTGTPWETRVRYRTYII